MNNISMKLIFYKGKLKSWGCRSVKKSLPSMFKTLGCISTTDKRIIRRRKRKGKVKKNTEDTLKSAVVWIGILNVS
jgi:hypothetical protein